MSKKTNDIANTIVNLIDEERKIYKDLYDIQTSKDNVYKAIYIHNLKCLLDMSEKLLSNYLEEMES